MNIEAIMKPLREFLSKMTKGQKMRLATLGVVIVALVVISVALLGRTEYVVLYSGLDAAEAGEIYNTLIEKQVDVKLDGTTISVPKQQRDSVLVDMAASGYPKTGRTYGLLENASGMGSTDAEKEVMQNIQLQEDLSQTIASMDMINTARVTLNIPKSSNMIKSEIKVSTASVFVDVKGGEELTSSTTKAITHLVASSAGIEPADIKIIDQAGRSYVTDAEGGMEAATEQHQLEDSVRKRMQSYLIEMLAPIYGEENLEASVSVKLSFDERLEQSVTFSPPDGAEDLAGLRVSMKELYEGVGNSANAEGNPGLDSNGGTVTEYQETTGDTDSSYNITDREINWELNEVKEEIKEAKGKITELKVSLVINGSLDVDDYTAEVEELISKSMGIDVENIKVASIPFFDNSEELEAAKAEYDAQLRSVQTQRLIRTIIIVVGILAAVLLLVKLIRDVSNNALEAKRAQAEAVNKFSAAAKGGAAAASIETDIKTSERQQVEDFIDKSPDAVAQLLRNWIAEDAR